VNQYDKAAINDLFLKSVLIEEDDCTFVIFNVKLLSNVIKLLSKSFFNVNYSLNLRIKCN
jgi:hypothetical protein